MDIKELEKLLRALANRRRLSIIRFLAARPHANLEDIISELHISYKSAHQHITHLLGRGIVDRERTSFGVAYFLDTDMPKIIRLFINTIKGA